MRREEYGDTRCMERMPSLYYDGTMYIFIVRRLGHQARPFLIANDSKLFYLKRAPIGLLS